MKKKISIHGSVVAKRLISNKNFKEAFGTSDVLLWESPFSTKLSTCNFNEADSYLCIDLYAATYSLYFENDEVYTNNSNLKESDIYRQNFCKKNPVHFNEIFKQNWKKMIQKYIDNILKYYRPEQIILVKSEKSGYESTPYHCRVTQNQYISFNEKLNAIENYFAENTNCFVIDLCKYYFGQYRNGATNPNIDYEEEFYDDIVIALKKIINSEFIDKIYSKVEYRLVLLRYVKYYVHMLRSNLQKTLLNNLDFVDHIVLNLGRNQILKNIDILVYMKYSCCNSYDELFNKYDFSKCLDLKHAIRCIEAIDKGNYSIPNFDYSIIFNEDMRLKILMIPKIRQCLAKEEILGNIEITSNNIDVCFAYLNLFLRKQYRKATELILQNTDKLINPIAVDIWGSCISREIYNLTSGRLTLNKYLYRSCCLHAFADKVDVDETSFEDSSLFGGMWRRNVIHAEFFREAPTILEESLAQWIVLDFFDLTEICFSYKGQEVILDSFGRSCQFFKIISSECTTFNWYEQPNERVKERMDLVISFLLKRYADRIILNRHYRSRYKITLNNQIIPFERHETNEQWNKKNRFIRKWEQYFIDKTSCYSIDIAKNFLGDEYFVWSPSPVHYENIYFEESIKIMEEIILNKPLQRKYEKYSYSSRIERILRLLPQNKNTVVLSNMFNEYFLDKILLQMDCELISKYKDCIEKIYLCEYDNWINMLDNFDFDKNDALELKEHILSVYNILP